MYGFLFFMDTFSSVKQQINKEIIKQKLDDELRDKILHPHLYKDCGNPPNIR